MTGGDRDEVLLFVLLTSTKEGSDNWLNGLFFFVFKQDFQDLV